MNPRKLSAIAFSCFVLFAVIFIVSQRRSKTPQTRASQLPENLPVLTQKSPSKRAMANLPGFNWRTVESDDYREYIKNLRSIGTPEETIRDIIIADIGKLFELRWKEMLKTYPSPPGSDVQISPLSAVKARLQADARKLQDEKAALVKELLGDDAILKDGPIEVPMEDIQQVLLAFLPPEKQESARQIIRAYEGRFQKEIAPILNGPFDGDEKATYLKVKQEKNQALAQVLTASEKEQFDLRFSQLSSYLHHRFQGHQLSEKGFQELYRFAEQYEMTSIFISSISRSGRLSADILAVVASDYI